MSNQVHLALESDLQMKIKKLARDNNLSLQELCHEMLQSCVRRPLDEILVPPRKGMNKGRGKFRFIDLFAGIGGIRTGFENVGGECLWSSEWDKFAQKTYLANYGERPHGDITDPDTKAMIPDHDCLLAGFPCQPFSIAGISKKQSLGRATGFEDKTQGTLFFDVAHILQTKRPRMFLLENVKNLRSHDRGNTWKIIRETLEELGYDIFSRVIDARYYVPQHRERIFIVGFYRDAFNGKGVRRRATNEDTTWSGRIERLFQFSFPDFTKRDQPKLRSILDVGDIDEKYTLTPKLWSYLKQYAAKHRAKGNGFGFGLFDGGGVARTLSARYYKDGSEILIDRGHGEIPRRLTPRECARLMGYGDDFVIRVSDTQAYRQFGNSVVVPVVEDIAKQMWRTYRSQILA